MVESDMDEVAGCIDSVLRAIGTAQQDSVIASVKSRVMSLKARFPLPYKL
jgi:glycine hydroxymethyltransferase